MDYVNQFLPQFPKQILVSFLKSYKANIGSEVTLKTGFCIENATGNSDSKNNYSNLSIADKVYIGSNCLLDLTDNIIIEKEVVISPFVKILTHQSGGERTLSQFIENKNAEVIIKNNCWLGTGAIILCGVHLGQFCVVAAGAVVTESFPEYSIVAGVPAKLIGRVTK